MKHRTALKQSIAHVKFLSAVIAVIGVLTFFFPGKGTFGSLAVISVFWFMDAYNIYYLRKRAAADSTFLDMRID